MVRFLKYPRENKVEPKNMMHSQVIILKIANSHSQTGKNLRSSYTSKQKLAEIVYKN